MHRKIVNALISLILLALFIFPCRFLDEFSDNIMDYAGRTVDAVLAENWDEGVYLLEDMNAYFRATKHTLYLFLDHDAIEGLDASLRSALLLMHVEDQPQSMQELVNIITISRYLKTVERFSWFTLL